MRLIVANCVLEKLRSLEMHYPKVDDARREELKGFERQLREQIDGETV